MVTLPHILREVEPNGRSAAVTAATCDAERALITSMILRPEVAARVASIVDVSDLAHPDHQAVYSTLLAVILEHGTVDLLGLRDALRRAGAGIADDVLRLAEIVDAPDVSSWCADHHAEAVADYAARRRARATALVLADDAQDLTRPIKHSVALAISALRGEP
jgi:replicative DNA helicase